MCIRDRYDSVHIPDFVFIIGISNVPKNSLTDYHLG